MVVALIVTYGNRFVFTSQVIDACLREGVGHIILVDNNSEAESKDQYEILSKQISNFSLIRNIQNLGSSGGYKTGLEYILGMPNVKFVWMLDDDNVPEQGALKELIQAKARLEQSNFGQVVAVYSYRKHLKIQSLVIQHGFIDTMPENNFNGFHLFKLKQYSNVKHVQVNYPVVEINSGPYGGLLITPEIIKRIGLPNELFFTYTDDTEWTMRLNSVGVKQFIVHASQITDIDQSGSILFPNANNFVKTYYGIRNHTYLSQRFRKNSFPYTINKVGYIFGLLVRPLFRRQSFRKTLTYLHYLPTRLSVVKRAIRDGEQGRLGIRSINELL